LVYIEYICVDIGNRYFIETGNLRIYLYILVKLGMFILVFENVIMEKDLVWKGVLESDFSEIVGVTGT
jgi:hypothetical protein